MTSTDIETVGNRLLAPYNLRITSYEILQSLWAGYGEICRLYVLPIESTSADATTPSTLILKLVAPPPTKSKTIDEGHLRKVISYHVESYFYTQLAPSIPGSIAVASCLNCVGGRSTVDEHGQIALMLTDLKALFPIEGEKRGELLEKQVLAALRWLAGFHGFWWSRDAWRGQRRETLRRPPLEEARNGRVDGGDGVWLNGGYTYLATRRKEYRNLAREVDSEWSQKLCSTKDRTGRSVAETVARFLSPAADSNSRSAISNFETLIHGDVKSENLFIDRDSEKVAFFDFQYVGLGLGVSDLAKLFTCSVPEGLLANDVGRLGDRFGMQHGEEKFLRHYLGILCSLSGKSYEFDTFKRHWETALVDWLRFQASWGFWGNTRWLEARVRHILEDTAWQEWIDSEVA